IGFLTIWLWLVFETRNDRGEEPIGHCSEVCFGDLDLFDGCTGFDQFGPFVNARHDTSKTQRACSLFSERVLPHQSLRLSGSHSTIDSLVINQVDDEFPA